MHAASAIANRRVFIWAKCSGIKKKAQRVRSRTSAVCLMRIDARNVCGPGEARAVGETQTMRNVKKGAVWLT